VGAYHVPTQAGSTASTNAGLPLTFPYQPIATPQPQVSTLFQEFVPLDPSYVDTPTQIVFHTTFGDYSFSKSQPFMSFAYRDGSLLISHSIFHVNSTLATPIISSGYTIDTSYLDNSHFRYSINLQSGGRQAGTLQISFVFDKINRPKITIRLTASPTLINQGFNILWILRGSNTFARFRRAPVGSSFGNYSAIRLGASNETQFELGPTAHPEGWHVSALVDWSDSQLRSNVSFGRLPLFSYLAGPVGIVTFPENVSSIDPTIVGQSTVADGSAQSFQRHSFFDGVNYWVFFYSGSSTVYEYSSDSRTWNHPQQILWSYPYTATWYKSGSVYGLAGSSASATCNFQPSCSVTVTLSFRKGTISGTSINWNSVVTVDSYTYTDNSGADQVSVSASYQDVNLVVGTDGLITAIYTLYTKYHNYSPGGSPLGGSAGELGPLGLTTLRPEGSSGGGGVHCL
jgi:hypothetical protein